MPRPLIAGLGPGIVCAPGYTISVTALHPTTGALVTGVSVTDVALEVEMDDPPDAKIKTLPPLLTHEPQT